VTGATYFIGEREPIGIEETRWHSTQRSIFAEQFISDHDFGFGFGFVDRNLTGPAAATGTSRATGITWLSEAASAADDGFDAVPRNATPSRL